MSAEKRITKRQMKGDRLVSTTFKATEYIRKNQSTAITIGIAVLVVLAGVFIYNSVTRSKVSTAAQIMSRAEMEMAMGQMDQYVADLQTVTNNYGGTPSGRVACYTLANMFFNSRQYDKAEQYFRKTLDDYSSDKMMVAGASAGLAACLEIKSDYAGAGKMYRQAADADPDGLWASGYLLKAGQAFARTNDKKSAEDALSSLEKKYPNAPELTAARRTLAEIKY